MWTGGIVTGVDLSRSFAFEEWDIGDKATQHADLNIFPVYVHRVSYGG